MRAGQEGAAGGRQAGGVAWGGGAPGLSDCCTDCCYTACVERSAEQAWDRRLHLVTVVTTVRGGHVLAWQG